VNVTALYVITPPLPPPLFPPTPPLLPFAASNQTATDELLPSWAIALIVLLMGVAVLITMVAFLVLKQRRSRDKAMRVVVPVTGGSSADAARELASATTLSEGVDMSANATWREPKSISNGAADVPAAQVAPAALTPPNDGPMVGAAAGVEDEPDVDDRAVQAAPVASPTEATTLPKITKPPALQWASNLGFELDPSTGSLAPSQGQTSGAAKLRAALKVAAAANRLGHLQEPDREAPVLEASIQRTASQSLILGRWKSERAVSTSERAMPPSLHRAAPSRPAPTFTTITKAAALGAPFKSAAASLQASTSSDILVGAESSSCYEEDQLQPGYDGGGGVRTFPPKLEDVIQLP